MLSQTSRCANFLANCCSRCVQPRRTKKKWVTAGSSTLKNDPTNLALKQFDQQYGTQFKRDWPSMRLALLSLQKYGALINRFCDSEEVTQRLSDVGAQDFVASMSDKLRTVYAGTELGGLESERRPTKFEQDVHRDEYANLNKSQTPDDPGNYYESNKNKADLGSNEPRGLKDSNVSRSTKDGDVGAQRSGVNTAWRDEYIVAPGYESKLEYLIGQEEPLYQHSDSPDDVTVEMMKVRLSIDPSLRCHVFPEDRFDRFPPSRLDAVHSCLMYYTLDASSLLPVIALDIQPDDSVLDMCAAPGGKSLAIMNILEKGGIVLNEPSTARRKRLMSVLESYVPQGILNSGNLQVTSVEGQEWGSSAPDTFDKVLVDVPCTTDRLSAKERDNNIFSVKRNKERWELPSLQEELLCSALQSVKPGGDVVYSTCSLSSLQNDAVVQGAIRTCREEYNITVQVVDLSPLADCSSKVFKYSDTTQYGQLVVPEVSRNFGPMYFARLRKISSREPSSSDQLDSDLE